jgi:two-component system, OmpR family, sensor histidine kinase CpxA
MSLFKVLKLSDFGWLKHPRHYLFLKIFSWFWLTIIGTVAALFFLSSVTSINAVSNKPLHGPMKKNLAHTANNIEFSTIKHHRALIDTLNHPRRANGKLLYLSAEQAEDSISTKNLPDDIDLSLLNFSKNMPPQVIYTEQYQALGPIKVTVPEGDFFLYEINVYNHTPFYLRLRLMPGWVKLAIAIIASLILSFLFSRNLIAPINSLKQAAVNLAAGDLTARAAISANRKDELGILARDFNRMAEQLALLICAQKRLLADISHELRSPLTRLKMATGLAQMQANDASQSYLLRIEKEANQLDKMIADVLQVSRLEANSQTLSLQQQPLQDIVDHVLNDATFEAKQLNKQLQVTGSAEVIIQCDEALIASALENLLRNAIHYATSTISLSLKHSDKVCIEICDDGPGVPDSQLSKLCEPFFRQSDARDRVTGGTGLGLAIAKNAIMAHGGSLTLANKPQGGLCATISLPIIKE